MTIFIFEILHSEKVNSITTKLFFIPRNELFFEQIVQLAKVVTK